MIQIPPSLRGTASFYKASDGGYGNANGASGLSGKDIDRFPTAASLWSANSINPQTHGKQRFFNKNDIVMATYRDTNGNITGRDILFIADEGSGGKGLKGEKRLIDLSQQARSKSITDKQGLRDNVEVTVLYDFQPKSSGLVSEKFIGKEKYQQLQGILSEIKTANGQQDEATQLAAAKKLADFQQGLGIKMSDWGAVAQGNLQPTQPSEDIALANTPENPIQKETVPETTTNQTVIDPKTGKAMSLGMWKLLQDIEQKREHYRQQNTPIISRTTTSQEG
jgi:hypothetical protein